MLTTYRQSLFVYALMGWTIKEVKATEGKAMTTRGKLIRDARQRMGLSQQQVADAAKLTQQAYSNIENDRTDQPRRSALKAIARCLGLDEEQLFTLQPAPSREAMTVACAFDTLPANYQARILHTIIEGKDPPVA